MLEFKSCPDRPGGKVSAKQHIAVREKRGQAKEGFEKEKENA